MVCPHLLWMDFCRRRCLPTSLFRPEALNPETKNLMIIGVRMAYAGPFLQNASISLLSFFMVSTGEASTSADERSAFPWIKMSVWNLPSWAGIWTRSTKWILMKHAHDAHDLGLQEFVVQARKSWHVGSILGGQACMLVSERQRRQLYTLGFLLVAHSVETWSDVLNCSPRALHSMLYIRLRIMWFNLDVLNLYDTKTGACKTEQMKSITTV